MLSEDLIYEILSVVEEIPAERVATYGQIARLIANPKILIIHTSCHDIDPPLPIH
ncbi:MAG: MGMT family protein [Lachnospiraceae bacterium]|nr:MGMT family protein [Lachnospiraceae bacterium]